MSGSVAPHDHFTSPQARASKGERAAKGAARGDAPEERAATLHRVHGFAKDTRADAMWPQMPLRGVRSHIPSPIKVVPNLPRAVDPGGQNLRMTHKYRGA
eukprot:CAMPEP_0119363984 /NCGR_PEP_ID=MMETSP1334-20130426/10916_1 /TAXON_ID=127549 /ORGANISM="Calcidiscus leptoporus, Strain RCC1130" /LENGTH=99 /DNA_ID=CAMNT_0007379579 /DNA_START=107 /DNA_END=407 /DNA_ORIENTATION=+